MREIIMRESIQNIYNKMEDAQSRKIYLERLNYSITSDNSILEKMIDEEVRSRAEWQSFLELLKGKASDTSMYIFGAGIWGGILYNETKDFIEWQGVIDNQPMGKAIGNLDIVTLKQFIDSGNEKAVIVISSYKNSQSMLQQLERAGISPDRMIDAGKVIYGLTEGAIYFDLKELEPRKPYEVFVDAGGFDGLTTREFFRWCKGEGYSYCFEFDSNNIASIKRLFTDNLNCSIVPKALWSETTCLFARVEGNYASSVTKETDNDVQKIEAVALDDFLKDKPVTFIKMDIEGAELEAIKGARNIIRNQHPKLAVSIYHKAEDIWTIPQTLLEYYPEYRFYLRHYSFSYYDTVLYAVARQ